MENIVNSRISKIWGMTLSIFKHLLLLVLLLVLTSVQAEAYNEQLDIGEIKGSTYENKYFGFSLQIPEKWHILNKNISSQIYEKAKDNIIKDDTKLRTSVDSYNKPQTLLWVVKYPFGSAPSPNISITAVELDSKSGVIRGKQLFGGIVKVLENAGLNCQVIKEDEENIGGIKFDTIEIDAKSENGITKNKFSVAILRGHALMICSTYKEEEDFRQIDLILQSIKFNRWFLIDENKIARIYMDTSSVIVNGECLSCWLLVDSKGITLYHHMLIKKPSEFSYMEMIYIIDGKEHNAALVKDKWDNEDSNPTIGRNIKKCIHWAEEQGIF